MVYMISLAAVVDVPIFISKRSEIKLTRCQKLSENDAYLTKTCLHCGSVKVDLQLKFK